MWSALGALELGLLLSLMPHAAVAQANAVCVDSRQECLEWAGRGGCVGQNGFDAIFMQRNCPAACNTCGQSAVASGMIPAVNPVVTPVVNPVINPVVAVPSASGCVDTSTNCPIWAALGECNGAAAVSMQQRCPSSCKVGVCTGGPPTALPPGVTVARPTAPAPVNVNATWLTGNWTVCSGGTQTRTLTCMNGRQILTGNEAALACPRERPPIQQACTEAPTYRWSFGQWGACTVTCAGEGTQIRTVQCMDQDGKVVAAADPSTLCTDKKPSDTQTCAMTNACPVTTVVYEYGYGAWSACSVTCGGQGVQNRIVLCGVTYSKSEEPKSSVDDQYCAGLSIPKPVATQPCTPPPCPTDAPTPTAGIIAPGVIAPGVATPAPHTESPITSSGEPGWAYRAWKPCSVTCGPGTQTRDIYCSDGKNGTASESECMKAVPSGRPTTKPASQQPCNAGVCIEYEWKSNPWGVCSVTCGTGVKTRTSVCQAKGFTNTVAAALCDQSKIPAAEEACIGASGAQCQVYAYATSPWGTCSVTCGYGIKLRSITCTADGQSLADTAPCTGLVEPDTRAVCTLTLCTTYDWGFSDWSKCSKTCGAGGTQTRSVFCLASTGVNVDDALCQSGKKPAISQECNVARCEDYSYGFTVWGVCSTTCGEGVKKRDVFCMSSDRGRVAESYCAKLTERPATTQPCNDSPCLLFRWTTAPWGLCDATCGTGIRKRTVSCTGSDGVAYDESKCFSIRTQKPATTQVCINQDVPCKTYSYTTTFWCSKAPSPCFNDTATFTRTVQCIDSAGMVQPSSFCKNDEAPPAVVTCTLDEVMDDYIEQYCAQTQVPIAPPTMKNTHILQTTIAGRLSGFNARERSVMKGNIAETLGIPDEDIIMNATGNIIGIFVISGADPVKMLTLVADLNNQKMIPNPMFPILGATIVNPEQAQSVPQGLGTDAPIAATGVPSIQLDAGIPAPPFVPPQRAPPALTTYTAPQAIRPLAANSSGRAQLGSSLLLLTIIIASAAGIMA